MTRPIRNHVIGTTTDSKHEQCSTALQMTKFRWMRVCGEGAHVLFSTRAKARDESMSNIVNITGKAEHHEAGWLKRH